MSRYSDYDDYDDENAALNYGRWQRNARAVIKGKRGRKILGELREALMALPEKKLIEGAVCTVGAGERRAQIVARERAIWERMSPEYRSAEPWLDQAEELDGLVQRNGEGVCAVGALVWHRKVKAGLDPAAAFAALPDIPEEEGADGLAETADFAKGEAGLVYTLAWELAYRNDETFRKMTPEGRWTAFIAWIDTELAEDGASAA